MTYASEIIAARLAQAMHDEAAARRRARQEFIRAAQRAQQQPQPKEE